MKKTPKLVAAKSWSGKHLGAAVVAILLLGGLFTAWAVRRENRAIRETLLQQTRLVAQALPLDRLQVLEGTPADEDKPEYRILSEQLRAVVRINPSWECIYLMGFADGQIFFQLDAGIPGYPNPARPGQLYEEASERVQSVFKTRVPSTEGPVRDRWGTWVSAFVPLSNPRTGQLVTVVGIDIKDSVWHMRMAHAAVVPLLCTALLLALAVGVYRLRNWRRNETPGVRRRWRTLETLAVGTLGLILTGAATWVARTVELGNRRAAFSALARIETERIQEALHRLRNAELAGVAHFIKGSRDVTREEFRTYARYLIQEPRVLAWGWVPAVKAAEKDIFEQQCREAGSRHYQIWTIDADGKRSRAPERETHYPIHSVESVVPLARRGLTCGRDLGAIEAIRPTLEKAEQTRLIAATDLLAALPGDPLAPPLIAVFLPLYRADASDALRGFALALLDPQRLLDACWGEQLEGNRQLVLTLRQLRPETPPERLAALPRHPPTDVSGTTWSESRPILAFGNAYAATVQPTAEFIAAQTYHVAWIVLLAGLAFTAAGTIVVVFLAHRREDLERCVVERTAALALSIRRYDLLAQQSRTITWQTDPDGLYVEVSAAAAEILGYRPEELVGKLHFYDLHPEAGRADFKARALEAFARREPFLDLVNPAVAKSGEIVWLSTDGLPVLDGAGNVLGYQGTDKDITARKQAENALAKLAKEKTEAAERYRALIRASDTGAWEYHHDTRHMWTSSEYFAMLGRDPADYVFPEERPNVQETWLDLIHPDDRAQAHQDFIDYMERPEGLYQHTFRMSHADGRWLWILSRGQLLRDAEGHPTPVLLGTHIDITERKQTEQFREIDTLTLQILNRPGDFRQRLDELAALFQDKADFDAISIRLCDGNGFPVAAHRGLAPEHLAQCRDVIELDPQGIPRKDAAGNVILACTCGLALAQGTDRKPDWFSPGGSCWTNDLARMVPADPEPRAAPRDHCLQAGYAAIAWVPIRVQGEIIGLIQFLSRRKGRFSAEAVQILESIAAHVGEVWQRRRAEQDYRTLFQTMFEGFALHELIYDDRGRPSDYRFLALNPAFERMTGLNAAELVGKTVLEAMPGVDRRWIEIYGSVVLTGNAISFENHSAAQDRYFEVTVFRPAPNQFACISSDVTERKLSESRLRENRRRYAALLANLPGMAYRCQNDRKWTMEFVSQGCQTLTGYAPEELVGNHAVAYSDIIALPYREFVWQEWQKAIAERRPFEGEYQIVTRTGETKWVWERGDAVHNSQGRFVGLEGFIADVTDRKRAETEREQLIRAIEQSTETIVITDARGSILYVNPAFSRTTGFSREEALGQNPRILKSGIHDATFYREMWETLQSGAVWEGQIVNQRKDGTPFTEQATISPVRDYAGRIVNFVAVKRDITQQLHDQRERENLQSELAQAQKMESIGRLAGGVAHDFNNMLQAILGYTEMAMEQVPADQPLHDDLLEIQKAAQRSSALTRQLQVFARKQTMAPKVLDLNQAVEGMLAMLRRLIGEDIQLEWRPGAELGSVKIDPSQLDQIVANLSVNARDAIEKTGHVILETQNAQIDRFGADLHGGIEPGAYVLLAVSDDGCGMGPDVLQHLFEPFFTTKPLGKGTGLGLSTVYGIVKQNGGGIQVYSEPGRGTTFKIYLPRIGETADAVPKDEAQDPSSPNHETILLVEDEESILQTSRRMLESLGYRVLATNSPNTAIRMAEGAGADSVLFHEYTDRIDLLITDVIMPEMNGPDLVAHLKSRFPELKHLFMSGYTANLIAVQGVQAGKMDFIQKPFSRTALAQKVREILDRK